MRSKRVIGSGRALLRSVLGTVLALGPLGESRLLAQAPPPIPTPTYWLVNAWKFETTNWASIHGTPPREFFGLEQTPSPWGGNALRVGGTNALLEYPTETNGAVNLPHSGAVSFWFRPTWDSGTGPGGGGGQLLEMTATDGSSGWGLAVNVEGSQVALVSHSNQTQVTCLSAPVNFQAGWWHRFLLAYSATNATTLYIDDYLAASGPPLLDWPGGIADPGSFTIGGRHNGVALAQGDFEDLITYGGVIGEQTATNAYWGFAARYPLGPDQGGGVTPAPGTNPDLSLNLIETLSLPLFDLGNTNRRALLITSLGTNQFQLTVTNGLPSETYQVFWTPVVPVEGLWMGLPRGSTGQTNFFVNGEGVPIAFFQALAGMDWDGDGVENWMDANPNNTNILVLTVIIDTPQQNEVVK